MKRRNIKGMLKLKKNTSNGEVKKFLALSLLILFSLTVSYAACDIPGPKGDCEDYSSYCNNSITNTTSSVGYGGVTITTTTNPLDCTDGTNHDNHANSSYCYVSNGGLPTKTNVSLNLNGHYSTILPTDTDYVTVYKQTSIDCHGSHSSHSSHSNGGTVGGGY